LPSKTDGNAQLVLPMQSPEHGLIVVVVNVTDEFAARQMATTRARGYRSHS